MYSMHLPLCETKKKTFLTIGNLGYALTFISLAGCDYDQINKIISTVYYYMERCFYK